MFRASKGIKTGMVILLAMHLITGKRLEDNFEPYSKWEREIWVTA